MPELTPPSEQPPQLPSAIRSLRKKPRDDAKSRRGRPRQDDYVKQVIPLLRADLFQLNGCTAFTQLPGARATARL